MANSKALDIRSALQDNFRAELNDLCFILSRWLPNRRDAKKQLLLLADKLNEHQKNVNIAQVTGTSTSIVAAGLIIGGFAASFFTFGASLIVSGVGSGIGGLGGLTTAGAGITFFILKKKLFKKAQEAINRDIKLTEELRSSLESLEKTIQIIRANEDLFMSLKDKALFAANLANCLKSLGKNLVGDFVYTATLARVAANAADIAADTASTVFKTMTTTTARVFHIGGFAAGMVLVPIDVYTLVTSSISLHNGSTSDAENKIRGIVNEMMCPEEEQVSDIVDGILNEMMCGAN